MFKIGHLGTFPALPELGMAIYAGDTAAVEALIQQGADIDEQLTLSRHSVVAPLDLALMTNQPEVVRVLVAHGANLNAKDSPAILTAARYGNPDILRYLHLEGAKLNAVNRVKSNAYD
ncbi:ankyrin repeat domain-containing protein [Paenibacillus daejeonensis]|uniref:ankyrin repeat domain-containing protein n=1 Tax=Paenibacillus daejeonensis TaxID=135193 RepID=UPI00035F0357|nr:ankyrin repeat domain-containing protein [Paenibacillus daejeonensis]